MTSRRVRTVKSLFAMVLVAGSLVLLHAGQIQNPIQAAKDAYNKAKQQQQQNQKPQQPAPQGQATQPANAPDQSSSTSPGSPAESGDCCSPEALKKIAASSGFVDIVGIKLGMTPTQATAAIKAYKPTLKIEVLNTRLFHPDLDHSDHFIRVPRYISAQEPNNGKGYESISIEFTQPPSPPLVSRIERHVAFPPDQPVVASNLLESFRKKYGQENLTTNGRAWVYDLNGKLPVRLPNGAHYCSGPTQLPLGSGEPQADYGQVNLSNTSPANAAGNDITNPDCVPYVVVAAGGLSEDVAPNAQVSQITVTLQSGALVNNSTKATYNWLKAEADGLAKQQEDAAKARTGPKL